MKRLILTAVLAAMLVAGALGLAAWGGLALAAGPDPEGNNPWNVIPLAPPCDAAHGAVGRLLINENSGKTHCFKL